MDKFQFDFEKLKVYQKALNYIDKLFAIYKKLPGDYKICIGSNMIRAGLSIANNLAEGNGKQSKKEKNRFFSISLDSTKECVSVFNVLDRQKLINETEYQNVRDESREITSMLIGLIKYNQ